jgi:hypothetical protein
MSSSSASRVRIRRNSSRTCRACEQDVNRKAISKPTTTSGNFQARDRLSIFLSHYPPRGNPNHRAWPFCRTGRSPGSAGAPAHATVFPPDADSEPRSLLSLGDRGTIASASLYRDRLACTTRRMAGSSSAVSSALGTRSSAPAAIAACR